MKSKKLMWVIIVIIIGIITLIILNKNSNHTSVLSSSTAIISNKKIGWGIKRGDNNNQPDLGNENKSLINMHNGIAMGNSEEKIIYLTFDEGYEAGYTEKILNTLKENNVKAAFFITGHYLNTQENLVKQMIDEGHIVGNHTVNHHSMPDLTEEKIKDEVMNLHQALYEKFKYEMKYLRPPMGEFSEKTLTEIQKLGYIPVMWSFAYDDWDEKKQGKEEYAKEKILSNIHNGEVMLLHANSIDNCNILDYCIKEIKNMGYEFKTLDEFKM